MATNKIAYGFVGLEHLFQTRVAQAGVARIWTAVQESAAEHTRQINALMGSMVERTVAAQEQYELPVSGVLQPLDEWGRPRPVKPQGSYQVGYPIRGGGFAWGGNRITNALLTVEEANRNTISAQAADANWLKYHLLAALLDNTAWTFHDETQGALKGLGDISIYPLANGDAVTYMRRDGSMAVDTHYYAQLAAIDDSNNPFPTIYAELNEHPSNQGGPMVAYVASNLKTAIEGLTGFTEEPDPDVEQGSGTAVLVGSLDRGFGDQVLGKVNKMWIVEWGVLPDGYMIAHAQGGGPILKMREYPAAELQGLFPEQFTPDGNLTESRLLRFAGFGVANRIGAVVAQIGNATYQIPTGWSTPLVLN